MIRPPASVVSSTPLDRQSCQVLSGLIDKTDFSQGHDNTTQRSQWMLDFEFNRTQQALRARLCRSQARIPGAGSTCPLPTGGW